MWCHKPTARIKLQLGTFDRNGLSRPPQNAKPAVPQFQKLRNAARTTTPAMKQASFHLLHASIDLDREPLSVGDGKQPKCGLWKTASTSSSSLVALLPCLQAVIDRQLIVLRPARPLRSTNRIAELCLTSRRRATLHSMQVVSSHQALRQSVAIQFSGQHLRTR